MVLHSLDIQPYFNPRSLAGATYYHAITPFLMSNFNPRSLAGATCCRRRCCVRFNHFNPRSLAGATNSLGRISKAGRISIHAPSRERRNHSFHMSQYEHFNPRSLAGATQLPWIITKFGTFQSTLPRGSDSDSHRAAEHRRISIHAPSRERRLRR